MKKELIKTLIEKYEAGTSTLEEEQFLFENADNSEATLQTWAAFVTRNKIAVPDNLNTTLWDSFQKKKNKTRRIQIGIISAAASVLLLISLFIYTPDQKKLSYHEKEILLNKALNMIADTTPIQSKQRILYEDDLITIYSSND
ncbi:hypothetical protein CW731_13025 [Polaribacter sp. ALD11]|uniref:hypothetical protein n=1 Tax=Polaribacter sp. ALD11 TaxID=2058137 RepID=UPI000C300E9B|nr:hypothetical protein [Polaribacter sp. ALD11]AUC86147.1 hypothetical protein CW731_13025 [Polaribacter sp. ALD11]